MDGAETKIPQWQNKSSDFFNKDAFVVNGGWVQESFDGGRKEQSGARPRWLCSTLFDFIGVFFLLHLHLYHTTVGIEGNEGFAFRKGNEEFLAILLGREFPDGGVTLDDEGKRLDEE